MAYSKVNSGNIRISGTDPAQSEILSDDALAFLAGLQRSFNARRRELLSARTTRQARLDTGVENLDFPSETSIIRQTEWKIAPPPKDLLDRRVEITGPVNAKMIINALNSGASAFMADFEDATTPSWHNLIDGQANLIRAVRRTLSFADETSGKRYTLNKDTAVLIVRPRGWHMDEAHVTVDGETDVGLAIRFRSVCFPQRA